MQEELRQALIQELEKQFNSPKAQVDILIIVHNQYNHVKACLDSITSHTENYRLFLWDNGSKPLTENLLQSYNPYLLARANDNWGFIKPVNRLAALTTSPYIILLNSDVVVNEGWEQALIGTASTDCISGYQGGLLNEDGYGVKVAYGEKIDYVNGWCMCIPRTIYEKIGLFDENLQFAYGEDSDFCLKAKKNGYKLYALHLNYATHVGGATIKEVKKEMDVSATFLHNHAYLKDKWRDFLNG